MIEFSPYVVTAVVGFFSSLVTGFVTFLTMRRKNQTDAFRALIDANEKFRDEVRKDLEIVKGEKEEYRRLVEELQDRIRQYEKQINALRIEIAQYKDEIIHYQSTIEELKTTLNNYNES